MRKNNIGTRSLKGKRFVNLRRRVLSAAIIAASQTAWVAPVVAGPDGGRVVDGGGSIGRDGRNTTIHQRTDRMIIDWDSYNVAADEIVTYIQPGRDSVALNRILSHSGSEIHGQINANGQVVLVNPHGVFFGKNAQVNVGGLIASGMTVDVSDFMNGDFTFSAVEGAEGKVINQGLINAATGGSVTLLGKQVRNDGLISARLGAVNLAAGKEAVVTFDEAGLMGVRVSKEILQNELGVDAAVLNTGEITASGGRILLSGSTSQDIFSQAVNRGDLQQAVSAVVHEDGSFTLGGGADVVNTGTLNVSSADRGAGDIVMLGENVNQAGTVLASTQSGTSGTIELHAAHTVLLTENSVTAARAEGRGRGGTIQVLGHHVGLIDQAMVDASGAWGGGEVYIGGDYQGDNPFMPNAWRSFVGDQARINANALADGDGGRIIVWADDITRFFGRIEGKGAGEKGTGGFAEVSGKNLLRFDGLADMHGLGGVGTLLLDPRDIIITDWGDEDNVGPDVSFGDGEADEEFRISPTTLANNINNANVKLEATRTISVEHEINVNADSSNSLTLLAGKDILIRANLNLGQGDLYLTAGVANCGDVDCYSSDEARSVEISGEIDTHGSINIWAADNINLTQHIGNTASPTAVSFRAGNDITIEGGSHINVSAAPDTTAISLIAGDTTLFSDGITVAPVAGGDGSLIVGGNLNSYGTGDTRGGNIFLNATGQLTLSGDVITQGGHFTVGTNNGTRPAGFSMIDSTVNTGTASGGTGLDAGNIVIYTDGSADLGVMSLALDYTTVDSNGGANSIGKITVNAGEDIILHDDLDFNDSGPRTGDGTRNGEAAGESELSFTAGRNITLGGEIYDLWGDSRDALNIELNAGETLALNNNIYTSGGNFTASAEAIIFGDEGAISTRFANDLESEGVGDYNRRGVATWSPGGNVTLNAVTQMTLGKVVTHDCVDVATCTGNLTLSGFEVGPAMTSPALTQKDGSGLDIAGTTTINIGAGVATLNNNDNRFLGPITGVAQNLTVSGGDDGLTFGALTLTGNLTATATGNITDITDGDADNIIRVDGSATFNTNQNSLLLASRAHQLSAVDIVGTLHQVTLKNSRDLEVGAITTTGEGGAVDIETVGDLTVSGDISTRGRNGTIGNLLNPGVDGQHGGAIKLSASGALTVGELDANGGARRYSQARGLDGGDITLEADQVILRGDISSKGSAGSGHSTYGVSGGITIDGDAVIAPLSSSTITVDNTGVNGSAANANSFVLTGTLNGTDLITGGGIAPIADDGDDPVPDTPVVQFTINSGDVTFTGHIGNSTALGDLIINTYGDVDFGSQSFPNASSIQVTGLAGDNTLRAPDVAGDWRITAAGGGRLSAASGGTTSIDFSNMSTLVGSNFDDRFQVVTVGNVNLSVIGNRDNHAGNGAVVNTLVASDRNNIWHVYEGSESTLNDNLAFSGIHVLQGGRATDHFILSGADLFTGTVNGGARGSNRLDSSFVNGNWTLTDVYAGTLTVGGHELAFENIQTLDGSGTDSLQGRNQANVWSWTAGDDGTVGENNTDPFATYFRGMSHLIGGGVSDRLHSGTANSSWVMTAPHEGLLTANVGGQAFAVNFKDMQTITGSGNDTLTGQNKNSHWLITSSDGGVLSEFEGDGDVTFFSGMSQLLGGTGSDQFVLNALFSGVLDGGDSTSRNSIESNLNGGDWRLTGGAKGTLDLVLSFDNIQTLRGGSGDDNFSLDNIDHDALASFALIDGGAQGENTLDLTGQSGNQSLTIAVVPGQTSDVHLNIRGIQTLVANNNSNTLIGPDINATWTVTGEDKGTLEHRETLDDDTYIDWQMAFEGFANITGGSANDRFDVESGSISGQIDGGSGSNWLDYSASTDDVVVTIGGSDGAAGTITNIQGFIGNHDSNSANPFNSKLIIANAAAGSVNNWLIALLEEHNSNEIISDGINDGVYNKGASDQFYFINFNQLVGGEGNDTFTFSEGAQLTGSIDGGNGTNTIDATGSSLDHTFSVNEASDVGVFFQNIGQIQANSTTNNRLLGANRHNQWRVTTAGGGTLNEHIAFDGFDYLIGGTDLDEFIFSAAGRGVFVDGGATSAHGPNTVRLEGMGGSRSIGLGTTDADIQMINIGNVIANASEGHTLVGADQDNTWRIDGENAGKLNGQLSFSGFKFLRGNTADDTFVIAGDGIITGGIDGGDKGDNTLDLREVRANRALTIAVHEGVSADFSLRNIRAINSRSGAKHTLVAGDRTNTWSITGTNAGELGGVSFNGMANLVGGQLDDTFVFTAAGHITGLIDGGGRANENVLDYSNVPDLDIGLGERNDFINIQHLIGDNLNSTLRAPDQSNQWSLNGGVNTGTLNGDLRFTGITNLVGGAGHDVFNINGGALTGEIRGGKGSSLLNLTIGAGSIGRLRYIGGEGRDHITVNGGGEHYVTRYRVDGAGQESLSYTAPGGLDYELTYQGISEVQDRVVASHLELHGGAPTGDMTLRGNRFRVSGYSELSFHNKHNLTLAASSQDHLQLEEEIDVPGTFEIRNARVSQGNAHAQINARRLVLNNVAGFGTAKQAINTRIDVADIRLGRSDLYLKNQGGLTLSELTGSGAVSVQTERELNSTSDIRLSGSSSFISSLGDIALTGNNLLSGDITLSAAGNINLRNNRDSRLQGVQAQNLTLNSKGDITAPGVMQVGGLTTLTADGEITLANDNNHLNELEIRQAENVTVHAGHWLNLTQVFSSGDVYTRTEGLKLSDRLEANSFRFDAGGSTAVLDGLLNVDTLAGRAQGIVVQHGISVDSIELNSQGGTMELDADLETRQGLDLRGMNIEQNAALLSGGMLRVSSDANYRQRAKVTAETDVWVSAGHDITMESGALSHTRSGEIRYQAGNNLALGSLDASGSTVSLTASRGGISNNNGSAVNVVANRLEMQAGNGIGREASLLTDIDVLDAQTKSGRLAVTNQGELQVDRMASNGNIRLTNRSGHIYLNNQDGPVFNIAEPDALLAGGTLSGNYNLGTVVVEVADGSLFGLGEAHAHKPDLVGREVIMVARNGTVGSRGRPLVVYARDLSSTIAGHTWPMWWAFGEEPRVVENDSGIPQELLDFASAGSHQMVEVESLEDINPAIFTEVRNYSYGNVSVLLPPDQRYDDDDNQ